jgi:uncharacterized Zn finger protein (UPF0148 family)
MVCNSCNNEFTIIDGLKFCPYCGAKIEEKLEELIEQNVEEKAHEKIEQKDEQIPSEINQVDVESLDSSTRLEKKNHDTLAMPAITKKDIKKYKRDKFFLTFKKTFVHMKVIIPIIILLIVIGGGTFAYTNFIVKPVDEVRIKADILGKAVTLPKGTIIKIDKDTMKSFSISSRKSDKKKKREDIKLALTLNNGAIEAKVLVSLVYVYEGKNQWKGSEGIIRDGVTSVKPVIGMDEKKFLTELRKLSINIGDDAKILGGKEVKSLDITKRTPDLQNAKEEILVSSTIDGGLLAASGKIKCNLIFENEDWSVETTEKNSTEDFQLVLSPNFSDERAIEAIRNKGLDETVTYANFFGGKDYNVNDRFTKSIKIAGKKLEIQNDVLYVTAKRENVVGQLNSTLLTGYTFQISYNELALVKGTKTTVDSGKINNVPNEVIMETITGKEIEGSNQFFWFSNNHKITAEEAKTFKITETLSRKDFENVKYVYGSITFKDAESDKKVAFVAPYFLVYDGVTGYKWKLDKLVGEESPNYNAYSRAAKGE